MYRYLLLIFFALAATGQVHAYKNVKVILVADKQDQKDSLGYNVVTEMSRHIYNWVADGQLTLWDGPEKRYELTKENLQKLETERQSLFRDLPIVFIYEEWTSKACSFRFNIKGFSLASRGTDGQDQLFGYIEYSDKLEALLGEAYMQVNANGRYGLSLLQVLMNKSYDYVMVYYNDAPVRSLADATRINRRAMKEGKRRKNAIEVAEARLVEYSIEIGPSAKAVESARIDRQLQGFFSENRQEFFNYGGDEILPFTKKDPVIITRLHVQELWVLRDGDIYFKPLQIIPYVLGAPMRPVPISKVQEWQIKLDDKALETVLAEKKFYYRIIKINGTYAGDTDEIWKQALLDGKWARLVQLKTQDKGITNDNTN